MIRAGAISVISQFVAVFVFNLLKSVIFVGVGRFQSVQFVFDILFDFDGHPSGLLVGLFRLRFFRGFRRLLLKNVADALLKQVINYQSDNLQQDNYQLDNYQLDN